MTPRSVIPVLLWICACFDFISVPTVGAQDNYEDLAGEVGEDNSRTIRLRYLAVVPPLANPLRDGRSTPYLDPTVIPFSGWQFFSPEGESQPWIKRSGLCDSLAGQFGHYKHPKLHRMHDCWTVSGEMTGVTVRVHGKPTERFVQRVPSFKFQNRPLNGYYISRHYWAIKDPKQLPEEMSYRIAVSGETEQLATLKLTDALPDDLPMCKITYLGPARTNTEHYKRLVKRGSLPADFKPTYEITGEMDWDTEEWNYSFQWQPLKKLEQQRFTYLIPDVADFYVYTNMAEDEIRDIRITRNLNLIEYTKPFKTEVIKENWDTAQKQRKVSITRDHRFGEPVNVELVTQGGKGACFIDLDQVKAYPLPNGVEGAELAQFLEDKKIDLRFLINEHNRPTIRTVACVAYGLPAEYWDATPYECVRYFDDIRNGGVAEVPYIYSRKSIEEQIDRAFLATTSDGGMVIYRINHIEFGIDNQPAKASITIRPVVTP